MKVCYLDESRRGKDGVFVMAGVVVDAVRMHRTKNEYGELFDIVGHIARKRIYEIHATDLIPGNSSWRGVDGRLRSLIVDAILDWFAERKHKVTFSAVGVRTFNDLCNDSELKRDLNDVQIAAAFHIVLTLQRAHQREDRNKGHTLLVFDKGREPAQLERLIVDPPSWSDSYYDRKSRQDRLDQIIDVPYYANSQRVPLIQVADLMCYILRRYSELEDSGSCEAYDGEIEKYRRWVGKIKARCISKSHRYRQQNACDTAEFFKSMAPMSLTML